MGVFSSFLSVVQENAAISAWLLRPAGGGGGGCAEGRSAAAGPGPASPEAPRHRPSPSALGAWGQRAWTPGTLSLATVALTPVSRPPTRPPSGGLGGTALFVFQKGFYFKKSYVLEEGNMELFSGMGSKKDQLLIKTKHSEIKP